MTMPSMRTIAELAGAKLVTNLRDADVIVCGDSGKPLLGEAKKRAVKEEWLIQTVLRWRRPADGEADLRQP